MPRKRGSKNEPYESTVQGAFDDAKSEVEALTDELVEWRESLESNSMEHLPKYEEVSEASEYLENAHDTLESVMLPEAVEDLPVKTTQDTRRKATSRSYRAGNASALLHATMDALNEFADRDLSFAPKDQRDDLDEENDAARSAADEIQIALDDLDSTMFPGMF